MKKCFLMVSTMIAMFSFTGCKSEKVLAEASIVAEPYVFIEELDKPITYTTPKREDKPSEEFKDDSDLAELSPEFTPEPEPIPEPVLEPEPIPEPVPEPEPIPEPVPEPEPIPEPVPEPEPIPEPVPEPEPIPEPVIEEIAPVPAPPVKEEVAPAPISPVVHKGDRKEKVTVVDCEDANLLRNYNVVVGSFGSRTNADNMKKRMVGRGYNSFVIQNEKGMFRVVAGGYDSHEDALSVRDDIRETYSTENGTCASAWLLVPAN